MRRVAPPPSPNGLADPAAEDVGLEHSLAPGLPARPGLPLPLPGLPRLSSEIGRRSASGDAISPMALLIGSTSGESWGERVNGISDPPCSGVEGGEEETSAEPHSEWCGGCWAGGAASGCGCAE